MRALIYVGLVASALAATTAFSTREAQAREYPWCLYYGFSGSTYNCGFVSYAQCAASAVGFAQRCQPNPRYRGPEPRRRIKRR